MIDYTLPLDQLPDPLPIEPLRKPFDVTIAPPGSKSITNRAYVLAALAKGESRIIRPLRADDTDLLLNALCTLGATARWVPGESDDGSEDVIITGVNGRFPRGGEVNLGDGGTPTRFMIAAACLAAEPVVVDGSKRMRERPIAEGVDMLRQLGARIEYVEEEGRLPVRVVPSDDFTGGELTIGKTASSQFISAVMLIGSAAERGTTIRFSSPPTSFGYIHLTRTCLDTWDVAYQEDWWQERSESESEERGLECLHGMIQIPAQQIIGGTYQIDPDASSSIYWFMAAATGSGDRATVAGLSFGQPDVRILHYLDSAGPVVIERRQAGSVEITVEGGTEWAGVEGLDCQEFPDGSMALATAHAMANLPVTLTGLHTLRVKETDRIAALANELRKVGCQVETTDDSITIEPVPRERLLNPVSTKSSASSSLRSSDAASGEHHSERGGTGTTIIETYNDHRMAMAFAILGLRVPGIAIRDPACVKKSYPTFWKDFAKLYQ